MRCEHCGNEQPSGRFCDACGLFLTRIRLENHSGQPEVQPTPQVLKCHHCGHQQQSGRFCDDCGLMLDIYRVLPEREGEIVKRCPECGYFSKERKCRNCGIVIPAFPGEEE